MPSSNGRGDYNIAMLGASTSGKTTFLAALSIALARRGGDWAVVGADDSSTDLLIQMTNKLVEELDFPAATQGIDKFHWWLIGQTPAAAARPRLRRRPGSDGRSHEIRIGLNLADPSGEISKDQSRHAFREQLLETLVSSRGIVFIFDPINEFERGHAFSHMFGILAQLAQRMVDSPEFVGGRLPHYVAVCVSKFDEVKVLHTAEKLNMTMVEDWDEHAFPRVHDDDARDFFVQLCRVSPIGNAELVMNTLEQRFHRSRIKYFVSSAIGFYVDSNTGVYNPNDYQNYIKGEHNSMETRIRGTIYPINVVEPLLWLGKQLIDSSKE